MRSLKIQVLLLVMQCKVLPMYTVCGWSATTKHWARLSVSLKVPPWWIDVSLWHPPSTSLFCHPLSISPMCVLETCHELEYKNLWGVELSTVNKVASLTSSWEQTSWEQMHCQWSCNFSHYRTKHPLFLPPFLPPSFPSSLLSFLHVRSLISFLGHYSMAKERS